jgi:hypothetical protein
MKIDAQGYPPSHDVKFNWDEVMFLNRKLSPIGLILNNLYEAIDTPRKFLVFF